MAVAPSPFAAVPVGPSIELDTIIDNWNSPTGPLSVEELSHKASLETPDALAAVRAQGIAKNNPTGTKYQAGAPPIPQSERLWTVRPRSTGRKDRGAIARMRVLALDPLAFVETSGLGTDRLDNDLFSDNVDRGWNNFFLTDVQCQMSEKVQVMEVFGDNHVAYYFGKSPTMFTLSGIVFDNLDDDWFTEFIETYENFIRGSKLAKNYALLEIILPNVKIIGSVMSLNYSQNSQRDTDIQFSMQILAKAVDMIPLSVPSVGNTRDLLNSVNWSKAVGNLPRSALQSAKTFANLISYIQKPISPTTDLFELAGGLGLGGIFSNLNSPAVPVGVCGPDYDSSQVGNVGGPLANLASKAQGLSKNTSTVGGIVDKLGNILTPTDPGAEADAYQYGALVAADNKEGVQTGLTDFTKSLAGISSKSGGTIGGVLGGNNIVLGGIASTITGFKSGLFSPVFGFLSSITKIITTVTGNISKVLNAFTNPINSVLRDITHISSEIIGITNLFTSSVNQLLGIKKQTLDQINTMINTLRRAAGSIARVPVSISDTFGTLHKNGSVSKNAVILKSSHGRIITPAIILNSGTAWTVGRSMTLPSSIRRFS